MAARDPHAVASGPLDFDGLRNDEFGRLDEAGITYLDYTGSGLYAESQIRAHAAYLCAHVLGNPHSGSGPSTEATGIIARAREDVLDFFGADPARWTVCFTHNASAACKLVGEAYPFGPDSRFVLPADNHNSVNGIREFARAAGAAIDYLGLDEDLRLPHGAPLPAAGRDPSLFAFPAQSNFSGVQHPLSLIDSAREAGYDVLLDAAAFVPTNPLSLAEVEPDFVCVSFYKMFGYPTGVGALLARRESLDRLRRPWFSGGTVEWVTVGTGKRSLLPSAEAFEDGTPNFLDIAAVPAGLDLLRRLGMDRLHERVTALTAALLHAFVGAGDAAGRPVVRVYGPIEAAGRGATVAFNVLDGTGGVLPYERVEREAREAGIAIRGGCFCNPGASEAAFGVDPLRALGCLERVPKGAFHPRVLGDCLDGAPVGALRASFGIASAERDVERLVGFLTEMAQGRPGERRAAG